MRLFYGHISGQRVSIDEEEQNHLVRVLRLREGDLLSVTDGEGNLAKGKLLIRGKKCELDVEGIETNLPNFSLRVHIALAPTKSIDRTEFFVEKATEMGVSEISFLLTEKSERRNLNLGKIQKQVIAACKQSRRVYFPKLHELQNLESFLQTQTTDPLFVAHCHPALQRKILNEIKVQKEIGFLIGPEGDFSEREIQLLAEKRIQGISLGPQRLRTETAGIFAAAWAYSKMF